MGYFPAFLDLTDKNVVVVGGGRVAERKVRTFLKAGARVTLVAPQQTPALGRFAAAGRIALLGRRYRRGDLRGAFVSVAATDDAALNARIARDAPLLVNVTDAPERSNFIVPAVFRRGDLAIAVSTSGTSPALAAAIRRELEEMYGPEFARYLRGVKRTRKKVLAGTQAPRERRRLLKSLGSRDSLAAIRGSQDSPGSP